MPHILNSYFVCKTVRKNKTKNLKLFLNSENITSVGFNLYLAVN